MKIRDLLQVDPSSSPLANQGQARFEAGEGTSDIATKNELSTFVCQGNFKEGLLKIFNAFQSNLGKTDQSGAWVSGFYGSGKSHFLKMVCHLWNDTKFPDGSTARGLVHTLPDDVKAELLALDNAGKRTGGLFAAGGTLPSGSMDTVRKTVLAVVLKAAGLPERYAQACFCLWLMKEGWFEKVRDHVKSQGRNWEPELNNLYVSSHIARALLEVSPAFAKSESDARALLKSQFPHDSNDLSTPQFIDILGQVLKLKGSNGKIPCTLLVLDEVQQYLGNNDDRMTNFTDLSEAVSKKFNGHVMIVASGQSSITTANLAKLRDRYVIRVELADQEVESVIRKVILQKRPDAVATIKKMLEERSGEVSRQLAGTSIAPRAEDNRHFVDDYPLLPVRRRFWEECFRVLNPEGTQSQLRSQLRIVHDSVGKICAHPMGTVVQACDLYEALAPDLVNSGGLPREINERLLGLRKDGTERGLLHYAVCALVFLIGKLPGTGKVGDIGVRANKVHIADLLISDISKDNGRFREQVAEALEYLTAQNNLMRIGDEYHLQTREGAEWDNEFQQRKTKLTNDPPTIQYYTEQLLIAEANDVISSLKLLHGDAKESRKFDVSREDTPPKGDGEKIPLWLKDGWSLGHDNVVAAARAAGTSSPTIFVHIPQDSAEDIRRLLIESQAAKQTLDARATANSPESENARQSMKSRHARAESNLAELIAGVVAKARVYQGGGSEQLQGTLVERIEEAAKASLVRLYPAFKDADSAQWPLAMRRIKEGSGEPLKPLGYSGPEEEHPVCKGILNAIGNGDTGASIRKTLKGSPYGWPQDAIDTCLMLLTANQHVIATVNGSPVAKLDQNSISKAEFRTEKVNVSVGERIVLRGLFSELGVSCKSGQESVEAVEYLRKLLELGKQAGGPAPLPSSPKTDHIDDLLALVGNQQLAAIHAKKDELAKQANDWKKTKSLIEQRLPQWELTKSLARHAEGLGVDEHLKQLKAFETDRLLLEPTDPIPPIRSALSKALRESIKARESAHEEALVAGLAKLEASPDWKKLPETDRQKLIQEHSLVPLSKAEFKDDSELEKALANRSLFSVKSETDAIPGRIQKAAEKAAKLLQPKVRPIPIERSTLSTQQDLEAWLGRVKEQLSKALKDGPVLPE